MKESRASCHPERQIKARGLCSPCYRMYWETHIAAPALCHPKKPNFCKGLCKNCYDKGLKIINPEYAKRQRYNNKQWVALNSEKKARTDRAYKRKRSKEYHDRRWAQSIYKKYGITSDQYDKLLADQNFVCAICKRPPTKYRLHIDHDHKTNEVRGLLCFRCNYGLGWWRGNPEQMRIAANYLEGTL